MVSRKKSMIVCVGCVCLALWERWRRRWRSGVTNEALRGTTTPHPPQAVPLPPPGKVYASPLRYPPGKVYSTQTHSRHSLCLYTKETTRVTDAKSLQPNSSHKRPHTAAESRGRSSLAVLLNTFATVGKSICPRGMSGEGWIWCWVIW